MAHNLPVALTSFVGREAELAEVQRLISTRRLVTLTGVGGGGKTRLAVQTLSRVADAWPDGVWLVDLGSVTDPSIVPGLVASSLNVLVEPGGDQAQTLAAQLRDHRLLLCLDTCEHLLAPVAGFVDTVLRSCPGVSVLATSRSPLGVEGETVWRIPPLTPAESVQLFADRASLVQPDFDPDAVRGDVHAVCSRLDHIPLAIELAAAWVRALSPAQIAEGLDDRFRLLTGGHRGADPRHRAMVASIDWSHGLLAQDERILFRRLAVFSGTFTLDAVAPVCGDEVLALDDQRALELIGRLLDASLVTVREGRGGLRYRLLDTIRQYAADHLQAAGEVDELNGRHLDYFLDLAEVGAQGLETEQDAWRLELDDHRDNFHAALRWGLAMPTERAERGRRLAAALSRQWLIRGQAAEGLEFSRHAIELAPTDRSALQARLWAGTAMLGMISGRLDLVAEAAGRGAEIAREVGDDASYARCLAVAAYPVFYVDFPRCEALAIEAQAAAEAAGDPFARDLAGLLRGYTLQTRCRDEAASVARRVYECSWPRRDRFCAGFARGIEIFTTLVTGDVREAAAIGREVVEIVAPLGDHFTVGTNIVNAALAIGMSGDLVEARAMVEPIVRSLDTASEADVVGFMVPYGFLDLWDGDLDAAVRWFERGVQRMAGDVRDWQAGRCLPGLVQALRRLGRTDEALAYAEKAVAIETEFDAPYELSNVLDEQARLLRHTDPARSRHLLHRSLSLRSAHGLRTCYVDSLDALAELEADGGDHAAAVRLLASSTSARAEMGYPRPPVELPEHDKLVARLQSSLGEEFAAIWAEGAARPLDDVVALVTRGRGRRGRPDVGWDSLTPTEIEVARLAAKGLSNPEIANRLYMSRSTVKAHLSHVYTKLGVANRTELATLVSSRSDAH